MPVSQLADDIGGLCKRTLQHQSQHSDTREGDDNEWHVPWISDAARSDMASSVAADIPSVPPADHTTPVIAHSSSPLLFGLQPSLVTEAIQYHAENLDVSELYIDLSTESEIEKMVDDTTWLARFSSLTQQLIHHGAGGGIFVHAGLTSSSSSASKDKTSRLAAALLLRMMRIIEHLINKGLKFLLIVAWPMGSHDDLRLHGLAAPIKECPSSGFDLDEVSYQLVSNVEACHTADHLDGALEVGIKELMQHRASSSSPPSRVQHAGADDTSSDPNIFIDHEAGGEVEVNEDMVRQQVHQPLQLQGKDIRAQRRIENEKAIGGMRNPRLSLLRVPGHRKVGAEIAAIIDNYLDEHPAVQDRLMRAIGDKTKMNKGPTKEEIKELTTRLEKYFGLAPHEATSFRTQLHQPMYEAWVRASGDPDIHVPKWLKEGTPMGIDKVAELAGVFPAVHQETPKEDRRDMLEPGEQFINYVSIEESEHGHEVLNELVLKGFVNKYATLNEAKLALGGLHPILSKLALITTVKEGVLKHRLILDCRVNGVNDHALKVERIILPSAWDVIHDTLILRAKMKSGQRLCYMVLDFKDAFFMLPLWASECRYCASLYKGHYYIWDRVGQGTINGPNVYGRLAALTSRMGQGLSNTTEQRNQTYVDDPCSVILGTPERCERLCARLAMLWLALGWDLSYHKGQIADFVHWIGYGITVDNDYVTATIKEEFMAELTTLIQDTLKRNKISLAELRSLAGKANHVATLIIAWRPFLDQIWAAIAKTKPDNAGRDQVWIKAISSSLRWILVFLRGEPGMLTRKWRVDYYSNPGIKAAIYLDASPFGFGAILIVEGIIRSWFAAPLSDHDVTIHQHRRGCSKGQQTWEALVLLIAVKLWLSWWGEVRTTVSIKSDNLAALAMAAKMKSNISGLICKELALVMARASFQPRYLEHVPGVMNFTADSLSRLWDPSGNYGIPQDLPAELRMQVPDRDRSYYSTLQPNELLVG